MVSSVLGNAYPILVGYVDMFQTHMDQNIEAYEDIDTDASEDSEYQYQYWRPSPEEQMATLQLYYLVNVLDAEGMFSLDNDLLYSTF